MAAAATKTGTGTSVQLSVSHKLCVWKTITVTCPHPMSYETTTPAGGGANLSSGSGCIVTTASPPKNTPTLLACLCACMLAHTHKHRLNKQAACLTPRPVKSKIQVSTTLPTTFSFWQSRSFQEKHLTRVGLVVIQRCTNAAASQEPTGCCSLGTEAPEAHWWQHTYAPTATPTAHTSQR